MILTGVPDQRCTASQELRAAPHPGHKTPHFGGNCFGIVMVMLRHLPLILALLFVPLAVSADDQSAHQNSGGVLRLLPGDALSEHTIKTRDGAQLSYRVTAGTLDLFGQDGQRNAAIFYTAYTLKSGDAS